MFQLWDPLLPSGQQLAGAGTITGTMAATEGADVAAFTGDVVVQGDLAATEGADVAAFAGDVVVQGDLDVTEGADTAEFSGTVSDGATATASAASAAALTGHWRGPAGGKKRRHTPGQPRLLSELDPPLFTPEEILEAHSSYNVDAATRAEIEKLALDAFAEVIDTAARRNMQRQRYEELLARERAIIDEEETFLLM